MSHIVQIQTQIRDPAAIKAAAARLGLAAPVQGSAKLFSTTVAGLLVQLPGWRYPVVCDTASGAIQFDNYNGNWGRLQELHKFLQSYACEKTRLEARKRGHSVGEQQLADGSLKLTIRVNGGAA